MIEPINAYTQVPQNLAASKTEKSENADLFKQLLGQAVQNKTESMQESGSVQETPSTCTLSEISSIKNIAFNDPLLEIESKTDELIEKLSLYSSQLEDPKVSLKEMDGLLQEINSSAGDLLQATQSSGSDDQELMDIVRECAITAHSEYIKFQRGDYLDGFF